MIALVHHVPEGLDPMIPKELTYQPKAAWHEDFGSKAKNWLKGNGFVKNKQAIQESLRFQKKLASLSGKAKDEFIIQSALNCEMPGLKGARCWRNTQVIFSRLKNRLIF